MKHIKKPNNSLINNLASDADQQMLYALQIRDRHRKMYGDRTSSTHKPRHNPPFDPEKFTYRDMLQKLNLMYPDHLGDIAKILIDETAARDKDPEAFGVKKVINAPPRHGKTITTETCVLYKLGSTTKKFLYVAHSKDLLLKIQKEMRDFAQQLGFEWGVAFSDERKDPTQQTWYFPWGAEINFKSISSGLAGFGADFIVCDDLYPKSYHAHSPAYRAKIEADFDNTVANRANSAKTHMIVVNTRYHPADLSAKLIKEGWDHRVIKAIRTEKDENGNIVEKALLPYIYLPHGERKLHLPLAWLQAERAAKPKNFAAQYQQEPSEDEAYLFGRDAKEWNKLPPPEKLSILVGCDLAYTSGDKSDSNAFVVLGKEIEQEITEIKTEEGEFIEFAQRQNYYILESFCAVIPFPIAMARVREACERWGCEAYSYMNGMEKAFAENTYNDYYNVSINPVLTGQRSKKERANNTASFWNGGHLLIAPKGDPRRPSDDILSKIKYFTGEGQDDIVDALVSAFDQLHEEYQPVQFVQREGGRI